MPSASALFSARRIHSLFLPPPLSFALCSQLRSEDAVAEHVLELFKKARARHQRELLFRAPSAAAAAAAAAAPGERYFVIVVIVVIVVVVIVAGPANAAVSASSVNARRSQKGPASTLGRAS